MFQAMGFKVFVDQVGHPELDGPLKLNFGDAVERVRWRTGHALDYANTLEKCHMEGTSYILMVRSAIGLGVMHPIPQSSPATGGTEFVCRCCSSDSVPEF